MSRQFIQVRFSQNSTAYTYHNDETPVAIGDKVRVTVRGGEKTLEVVDIVDDPPPFKTAAILGKASGEEAA